MASAQKAAEDAKKQASKANSELYKLNIGFKNVSVSLDSKTSQLDFSYSWSSEAEAIPALS